MALTAKQISQQKQEAEELLFSGPQSMGFAKALFFGHFNAPLLFPYPAIRAEERDTADRALAEVREFVEKHLDARAIDRNAMIPPETIAGLGRIGMLGMTAPVGFGGRNLSQLAYTRLMEVVGGKCSSTAVFVNAHHSIGIRALLLFGNEEQKRRWLPPLTRGEQLAAFALTEPEAGSDASNVQTTATPTADGKAYVLNGTKRWITNGGIAGVLTVIARTPGTDTANGRREPAGKKKEITAFIVTPDMPGFKVLEPRMAKTGIRGTATGRIAFAERRAAKVKHGQRDTQSLADLSQHVLGRHDHVLEGKAAGGGAANARLGHARFQHLEARHVRRHEKRSDFLLFIASSTGSAGDDRQNPRDAAVGDPALRAVEDVSLAVRSGSGRGLHVARIGAGFRLRQGEGSELIATRQGRQPAAFLFLGAEQQQGANADTMMGVDENANRSIMPADNLHDAAIGQLRETQSTILSGCRRPEHAQTPKPRNDFRRYLGITVDGCRVNVLLGVLEYLIDFFIHARLFVQTDLRIRIEQVAVIASEEKALGEAQGLD